MISLLIKVPRSKPLLALGSWAMMLLVLASCTAPEESSSQSLSQADMQTLKDRKEQSVRSMWVMAKELPLYNSLPTLGQSYADTMLMQGEQVQIIDETLYRADNGIDYLYVQTPQAKLKGYVPSEYLVTASFVVGMTLEYTTHYFQPDTRSGGSTLIFLPAFSRIFSDDAQSKSPFVAYQSIDLLGNPLKGYLDRQAVTFEPATLKAYELYELAFNSQDAQDQLAKLTELQRAYPNVPFADLARELLDVRNVVGLGRNLRLFSRTYAGRRSSAYQERVIPVYSKPHDRARVLGYINDDRSLDILGGYVTNLNMLDRQPYDWYLIDHKGWVQAQMIDLSAQVSEFYNDFADLLDREDDSWLLDAGDPLASTTSEAGSFYNLAADQQQEATQKLEGEQP
jgi:hypothetical protein